jgi:rhodanese-related sulfurtransferase
VAQVTKPPPAPSARDLVEAALREVRTLDVDEARALLARDALRFVDVREADELARHGRLPGALHVPRGVLEFAFDPTSPWHRAECAPDAAADGASVGRLWVLVCGIGWRSALAAQSLQTLGIGPVAHLGGGFSAWQAAGAPVEGGPPTDKTP